MAMQMRTRTLFIGLAVAAAIILGGSIMLVVMTSQLEADGTDRPAVPEAGEDLHEIDGENGVALVNTTAPPGVAAADTPAPSSPRPSEPRRSVQAFSSCGARRVIALTFDDGPSTDARAAPALLDDLHKYGIPGTFYMTPNAQGESKLPARCELVGRIVREGHSAQMHSWTHPDMSQLSLTEIDYQLRMTLDWMLSCGVPAGHVKQFRPPYGIFSQQQSDYIYKQWNLVTAMWNVSPSDFSDKTEDAEVIFQRIVQQFNEEIGEGNSVIVLMHDHMYPYRAGLVQKLYEYFNAIGYRFVTGDECYEQCEPRAPDDQGRLVCSGPGGPRPYKDVFVP